MFLKQFNNKIQIGLCYRLYPRPDYRHVEQYLYVSGNGKIAYKLELCWFWLGI